MTANSPNGAMGPVLSVVIPARNEEHTLPRQLEALLAQKWDKEWELIVVDNGSTDGTAAIVVEMQQRHPGLRLVSQSTPGLCQARNAGIAAALAPAVAICDADDLVGAGWVAAMGSALSKHRLVTGSQELDRLNPDWLAQSRGRSREQSEPTFHGIFPFPAGNNFGLHVDLIDEIGGFDQRYIGAEDVEFGRRAWEHGIALHFVPEALVHYAYRQDARSLWRQGLGYGKARPAIVRDLAAAQLEVPPRLAGWKSWAWLLMNSPRAVTSNGRALLAWVAGNRIGHLVGSVQHRTLLL